MTRHHHSFSRLIAQARTWEAVSAGVALCRAGKLDVLMKGSLDTDHLMHAVMNDAVGLRTHRRISHVFILDGPLAFDNGANLKAARIKHIHSPVAGAADLLVVPDLESGNMLAKQLEYLAGSEATGVVLGARVPIVLTSRAEGAKSRLASCAVAVLLAEARRRQVADTGSGALAHG